MSPWLKLLADMMLRFLSRDLDLLTTSPLEARRIRGEDRKVRLVCPFLEFVRTIDNILKQMAAQGELLPGIRPQALRSVLLKDWRATECLPAPRAFRRLTRKRIYVRFSNASDLRACVAAAAEPGCVFC